MLNHFITLFALAGVSFGVLAALSQLVFLIYHYFNFPTTPTGEDYEAYFKKSARNDFVFYVLLSSTVSCLIITFVLAAFR